MCIRDRFDFMLSFFFKQKTAYEISACLVGSEMCIRDSKNTIRAHSSLREDFDGNAAVFNVYK